MRLVAGLAVIAQGLLSLRIELSIGTAVLPAIAITIGILLIAGLWTPISGWLVAVLGLWNAISQTGDPLSNILLGTIGAALALIGPGDFSVDAHLFGWIRIDFGDRKN